MLHLDPKLCNIKDKFARTPLHFACRKGFINLVEVLSDFGGSVFAHDFEKVTPIEEAFKFQKQNEDRQAGSMMVNILDLAQDRIQHFSMVKKDLYYTKGVYQKFMVPLDQVKSLVQYVNIVENEE